MNKKGFTIIELIVVVSIIALLIGVMIPGLNAIRVRANCLAQRCQLKDIEIGLETWAHDNDMEYPDSYQELYGEGSVNGSQKLCEALLGRDLQGFDTESSWNPWKDESIADVYEDPANFNRKGHYVDVTKIPVSQYGQIYNDPPNYPPYPGNMDKNGNVNGSRKMCYVFTDIFKRTSFQVNGRTIRVGTPILYYKSDSNKNIVRSNNFDCGAYDFTDNVWMMQWGSIRDPENPELAHPFYTEWEKMNGEGKNPRIFVEKILNYNIPFADHPGYIEGVPYNKETYILLSAGPDGMFGTEDDVWNLSK